MINLLNERDLFQRQDGKIDVHNHFDMIIKNKLEQGYKNKELIYTQDIRGIGKTYGLIQFAKENELNVIVASNGVAHSFRKDYYYDSIYGQNTDFSTLKNKKCVVDECVNIELIKKTGVDILTGFTTIKNQSIKRDKIICEECGRELNKEDFYLIGDKRFYICKKCITNEYEYDIKNKVIELLFKMNKPFIESVYKSSDKFGTYLRDILCFPQYKDSTFANSVFENKKELVSGKVDENINLIEVLNNEITQLTFKINKAREEDNVGTYKNLILSLGEVLRLKEKEVEKDWELKYSEYRLNNENGQKQVSVWEQNSNGKIRNHKFWDVKEKNKDAEIKPTINITMNIQNKDEIEQAIKDLEDKMKNIKIGLTI